MLFNDRPALLTGCNTRSTGRPSRRLYALYATIDRKLPNRVPNAACDSGITGALVHRCMLMASQSNENGNGNGPPHTLHDSRTNISSHPRRSSCAFVLRLNRAAASSAASSTTTRANNNFTARSVEYAAWAAGRISSIVTAADAATMRASSTTIYASRGRCTRTARYAQRYVARAACGTFIYCERPCALRVPSSRTSGLRVGSLQSEE